MTPLITLDDSRAGVIVQMDNFTIAVLGTVVPFMLFVVYVFWSGKVRPDNEPCRCCRRDAEDPPGRPQ
ncbi:MAG: hypothetical protein OXU88_02245 [Gammaproteobacteria bacterium]|nr:hypothetical protein [Gammaproteobacteria bacterium]